MADNENTDLQDIKTNVNLTIPDFMPSVYAHHMTLQDDDADVIICFFELQLPFIPPSGEERQKALEHLQKKGVKADCVAKLRVAKHRLPAFAQVLSGQASRIVEDMQRAGEKYGINRTDEIKN